MSKHYRHLRPPALEPVPLADEAVRYIRRHSVPIAVVVGILGLVGLGGAIVFVLSTSPWFAATIVGGFGLVGLAVSSYRVRTPIHDGNWLPARARWVRRELTGWPVLVGLAFVVGTVLAKVSTQEGWAHAPLSDVFFVFLLSICELAVAVRAARRAKVLLSIPDSP